MKLPEILPTHNITLKEISDWFGYKNLRSFQRSSGARRIEKGLERFYEATTSVKNIDDHLYREYAKKKGMKLS